MSEILKKRIASNEAKLKTLRTSATNASGGGATGNAEGGGGGGGVTGSNSASIGLYDAQIEKVTNNINSVSFISEFFVSDRCIFYDGMAVMRTII